jgi:hypothetical protein
MFKSITVKGAKILALLVVCFALYFIGAVAVGVNNELIRRGVSVGPFGDQTKATLYEKF